MVQVTFDAPDQFTRLPVGMTMEETRDLAMARLRDTPDQARALDPDALRETQRHSQALLRAGALYCGSFVGLLAGERSLATLVVSLLEFPYGDDPHVAAEGIWQSISAARGPLWEGGLYDLPCGQPACVLSGPVVYESPLVEPSEVVYAKLQAFVPVPDTPSLTEQALLVVDFASPAPQHLERYAQIPAQLLRSLSFSDPGQEEA